MEADACAEYSKSETAEPQLQENSRRVRIDVDLQAKFAHWQSPKPLSRSYRDKVSCSDDAEATSSEMEKVLIKLEPIDDDQMREPAESPQKRILALAEKCKTTHDATGDNCGKSMELQSSNFVSHVGSLKCDACGAKLKDKLAFRLHLRKHFENFICDQCGLIFDIASKFRKHVKKHDQKPAEKLKRPSEKGGIKCELCPMEFNSKVARIQHVQRVHKDGMVDAYFKCEVCSMGFNSRGDLRLHGYQQHFDGQKRFCDFEGCDKFFKNGKLLTIHKRCHSPPKYQCLNCLQRFVQPSGLRKHLNGRCHALKQMKSNEQSEEIKRIAATARTQYEVTFADAGSHKDASRNRERDEFELESDSSDDLEPPNVVAMMAEKSADGEACYLPILIKQEPLDDLVDEVEDEQEFSQEFPCMSDIVKQEDVLDESFKNPTVDLTRLEPVEIMRWTRVKIEVEEEPALTILRDMLGDESEEDIFKKPQMTRRKRYNGGKPRRASETPIRNNLVKPIRCTPGTIFTCDVCGVDLESKAGLSLHFAKHRLANKLKVNERHCNIGLCNRVFSTIVDYQTHKRVDHGIIRRQCNSEAKYKCDYCGRMFNTLCAMPSHVRKCADLRKPEETKSFMCIVCGKLFTSRRNLNEHMQVHGEPQKCNVCGRMVKAMARHLFRHKLNRMNPLGPCPICGKIIQRYAINRHIDAVHKEMNLEGRIYRCDDCSAEFTKQNELRKHITNSHYFKGAFQCHLCDSVFKCRKSLRAHRFVHEPKHLKCEVCSQNYATSSGLRRHKSHHHPEVLVKRV